MSRISADILLNFAIAWIVTIPATAAVACLSYLFLQFLGVAN